MRFRKKKHWRIRHCNINISEKCQKIFKSKHKRAFRNLYACRQCKSFLRKINMNLEEYIKMKRNETTEKINWINTEEGEMEMLEIIDIPDEFGKTIGKKEMKTKIVVKADDLINGLKIMADRLSANEAELEGIRSQIEKMGKVPATTNEIVRLRKNLELLHKINEGKKLIEKMKPLEEQIALDRKTIASREKMLKDRPKK